MPSRSTFDRTVDNVANSFQDLEHRNKYYQSLSERISILEDRLGDYKEIRDRFIILEAHCKTEKNALEGTKSKRFWLYAQIPQWATILLTVGWLMLGWFTYQLNARQVEIQDQVSKVQEQISQSQRQQ